MRTLISWLLVALVTILPVVALAGAVYAIIDIYLPMLRFAKLVLVLAMGLMAGFAFGVGALTGKMLMWARVRNLAMVWVVAALAALVAWYVAWVTWEWHLFTQYEPQIPKARFLLALLIRPRGVWLLATEINRVGTFGIGSGDDLIRGPFLWVLWAIEAAVVLGAATWVPVRMVRGRAFCERCQKWGRIRQGVLSVGPTPTSSSAGGRTCRMKSRTLRICVLTISWRAARTSAAWSGRPPDTWPRAISARRNRAERSCRNPSPPTIEIPVENTPRNCTRSRVCPRIAIPVAPGWIATRSSMILWSPVSMPGLR